MLPARTWLIALHAIAASLALVLGAFQILRTTRATRRTRRSAASGSA